jgi:hypothetical protein
MRVESAPPRRWERAGEPPVTREGPTLAGTADRLLCDGEPQLRSHQIAGRAQTRRNPRYMIERLNGTEFETTEGDDEAA